MIKFLPCREDFEKKTKCYKGRADQWSDHSFRKPGTPCDATSIGSLGWPFADNANYEKKHPVCDRSGKIVGHLVDGMMKLGYTFQSVYVDHSQRFFVAHERYRASTSQISIVAATKKRIFSDLIKFEQIETITLPDSWVGDIVAFKLLQNQRRLLFCGKNGYCLIDTESGRPVSIQEFTKWEHLVGSIGFNPNVGVAAVPFSVTGEASPLDGQVRYENYVELWDLVKGQRIGRQDLDHDDYVHWQPNFDETGRRLRIQNHDGSVVRIFNLTWV